MTTKVLIAGCGDVGSELGRQLVAAGFAVTGMRRSDSALPDGMQSLLADVTKPDTLQTLSNIKPEILVYCVAASEHNDEGYQASYVDGLRNVLVALESTGSLRHVLFTSSTGVYGQYSDEVLDETQAAIPSDFTGQRMLEAEALLENLPCASTAIRLSGIYGPGRNRMINLARDPQKWPQHNIWTNRIHRDDAAGSIAYLIERICSNEPVDDCYIVTDSKPVSQYEVLHWMASQFGMTITDANIPPVSGGKRLSNRRLVSTGYQLKYPDYISGYSNLIHSAS